MMNYWKPYENNFILFYFIFWNKKFDTYSVILRFTFFVRSFADFPFLNPEFWVFFGRLCCATDSTAAKFGVFRFIMEYSSLRDFWPLLGNSNNNNNNNNNRVYFYMKIFEILYFSLRSVIIYLYKIIGVRTCLIQ